MRFAISENTKVTISLVILIAVLVFVVGVTITITGWKVDLESRVMVLEEKTNSTCEDVTAIKSRQHEQDTIFAEILTDLKWIRAALETK